MRRLNLIIATCLSASLLAACSTGSGSVAPATESAGQVLESFGSSLAMHRDASTQRAKPDKASYRRALYIGDGFTNSIKILSNTSYHELGVITNGISFPFAESMDQRGNLYVANEMGTGTGDVTEYAPGDTSPSFTYSANMAIPYAVTVDRHGNVYEGDDSNINEYFQGFNTVTASCPIPGEDVLGLAVDTSGDVFAIGDGALYEYIGGLSNCSPSLLMSMQGTPIQAGLVLDSNNDLIAGAGLYVGAYVIAPPYSSVTRTIGSQTGTNGVSLTRRNKILFMANPFSKNVMVYNYQTGELLKVLGDTYGISNADSVVDGPDAVH